MSGMIEITCTIKKKSPSGKAILINDGTREEWVPISQIQVRPADKVPYAIVEMPEWLYREKKFG